MFLHWIIYKYTWTCHGGKIYNQIDHILVDTRWHSSVQVDLLTDLHSILNRWKYHLCKFSNVHGVNDVRQTEIHTAELLVLKPSAFWGLDAYWKAKNYV